MKPTGLEGTDWNPRLEIASRILAGMAARTRDDVYVDDALGLADMLIEREILTRASVVRAAAEVRALAERANREAK